LVISASEDRYAVRQYFDLFESTRIQFRVLETLDGKSAPEHVLNRINEYIEEFEIGEGDTFWVVCDCDHWVEPNHIQNLTHVFQPCRQKGIQVALSNPCFDLWLLVQVDAHSPLRGVSGNPEMGHPSSFLTCQTFPDVPDIAARSHVVPIVDTRSH
jgi:hypothetical protein